MYDDVELTVRFAIGYYGGMAKWHKSKDGDYLLIYEDLVICEMSAESYFWRKIDGTLEPLKESDLTPKGKTLVYKFIRSYCGG